MELALYLPAMILTSNLSGLMFAIMQGSYRYGQLARITILTSALRLVALLSFVSYFQLGVRGLILADVIGHGCAATWAYASIPIRRRWTIDRALLKRMTRFGLPLYLNTLLYFVYSRIDLILIGALVSPTGVAACSVARRVPDNLKVVMNKSFGAVFFPRMSALVGQQSRLRAEELLRTSLRVMGFLALLPAIVAVAFHEELIVFLFSQAYAESAPAFALFMVVLFFSATGTIMGHSLIAAGHPSDPLKVNIVTIVTNVVANLVLIPKLGFTGAAWAAVLMGAVTLPISYWFLGRRGYRDVQARDYLTPLLVFGVITALGYVLQVESIGARLMLVAAYPVASLALSPLLRADLAHLLGDARLLLQERLQRAEGA
jgi:O-antigen/teichoic acid export membrane protein